MQRGPKYKVCRRVGGMVFPQCQNPKFVSALNRKAAGGRRGRPKQKSEYGIQFLEKQKAKFTYGLNERQFSNYVAKAQATKKSNPANILSQLLERRLDNAIYRLGLASSRIFARQIVAHGHIKINDVKVRVPSFDLKIGDKISIRKESSSNSIFKDVRNNLKNFKFPKWIKFDVESLTGEVMTYPELADGDATLNLSVVSEFYSRT